MKQDFGRLMEDFKSLKYGWFNCSRDDLNLKFCQQISPELDYPQTILKHGKTYSIKNLMGLKRVDQKQMVDFLNSQLDLMFSDSLNFNEFQNKMKEKQIKTYFHIYAPDYYTIQYELATFIDDIHGFFDYDKSYKIECYREGIKITYEDQQGIEKFVGQNNHKIVPRVKIGDLNQLFNYFNKIIVVAFNDKTEKGKEEFIKLKSYLQNEIEKNLYIIDEAQLPTQQIVYVSQQGQSWKKWIKQNWKNYNQAEIDYVIFDKDINHFQTYQVNSIEEFLEKYNIN